MLPLWKVTFLLLVVFVMASPHHVVISKRTICTKKQKEKILEKCNYFIQPGYPIYLVSRDSPCCAAVREVQDRDMECVIMMLTRQQKTQYSVKKIRALHRLCELPSLPKMIGTCTTEQKDAVLQDCKKFIMPVNQRRRLVPIMGQPCCNGVNKVPKKGVKIDMQCVVELLTDEEKNHHDVSKILNLPNHC
ncbi:unnamed protein product [Urochloa decumbens]|uniref:Bifunctional inhibitor/plant lipid transfer protein/seed storage helical domain-containing protein n=2 Tax=Urochloa decumbens TaxID=240449 RepID=A0ABC9ARG7_9POAL